jgi:hypothetical protein
LEESLLRLRREARPEPISLSESVSQSDLVITAGAIPATTEDITVRATDIILGLITAMRTRTMVPGTIDITGMRIAGRTIGITDAGPITHAAATKSQSKKSLS